MTAYAVAGVLVVLVIVIVMVMSGKKKEPKPPSPTTPAPKAPVVDTTPAKPAEKPYPPVAESILNKGRELANTFEKDSNKATELYAESTKAHKAGDDKTWQSKLKEARALLENINDQWNAWIATLPNSRDYDTDDVAKHYLPSESGRVQKYVKLLASTKSDER
jgi:hypothetical protein